jgi:hypothetical protein
VGEGYDVTFLRILFIQVIFGANAYRRLTARQSMSKILELTEKMRSKEATKDVQISLTSL